MIRESQLDPSALDGVTRILDLLALKPGAAIPVALDLGLARGIAYYTGIVFEIKGAGGAFLGGGGRYDGLARALGSPSDVPALGFAYSLEHVIQALAGKGTEQGRVAARPLIIVPRTPAALPAALNVAEAFRKEGLVAEVEVDCPGGRERAAYARWKGVEEIVTVDVDGKVRKRRVAS